MEVVGPDLVFVSYAHEDAQWLQWLKVFLAEDVRKRRLELWADREIPTGREWRPEIGTAIARTKVALLLISPDFLASTYIMETELPALEAAGVVFAPVLVHDCLWDRVELLRIKKWLADPAPANALGLVTEQEGQLKGRLAALCRALCDMLPAVTAEPALPATPDPTKLAAVEVGSVLGRLDRVPPLPARYLVRPELDALIDALVATDGGAAEPTGAAAVGLHGQGGVGKSVLAAALARDERIRARFPDGVYWVTVGEHADIFGLLVDLLTRLGPDGRALPDVGAAHDELVVVLRDRGVLLVVDDVWSAAAARAFRATGARGRVLYTTRDPRVLGAAGAQPVPVDVLSPTNLRALAAHLVGVAPADLPPAADRALATTGGVALAVSLVVAAVRAGRSWDDVAADLVREQPVLGDHPYGGPFTALQVAFDAMPADRRAAVLDLVAFPADTVIPVAAIARLWGHVHGFSAEETGAQIQTLTASSVLIGHDDGVGFHDLVHDYLLLQARPLAAVHTLLLDAYRTLLPADDQTGWWRLPSDEPYLAGRLVHHLRAAERLDELATTVTDAAYLTARIAAEGVHAAEADLAEAALPNDPRVAWWRGWLPRHVQVLTRAAAEEAGLAATVLAWLGATTPAAGIDPRRLDPLLGRDYLALRWGLTGPDADLRRVLAGDRSPIESLAWSPDGTRLAAGAQDGAIRLWDPVHGKLASTFFAGGWAAPLAWAPDGSLLAFCVDASSTSEVRLWDPAAGEIRGRLSSARNRVHAIAWSPDGARLAAVIGAFRSHGGDELRSWDAASGVWSTLPQTPARSTLLVWEARTGTWQVLAAVEPDCQAVGWADKGDTVVVVGDLPEIYRYPHAGGRDTVITVEIDDPPRGFESPTLSPDGSRLAAHEQTWSSQFGHIGGPVHVWSTTTGSRQSVLREHQVRTSELVWTNGGTGLAEADGRATRIWSPLDQTFRLLTHDDTVTAVAWAPDDTTVACAAGDDIWLWDVGDGQDPRPAAPGTATRRGGVHGPVQAVACSPDGQVVAVTSDSGAWLVDPVTGAERLRLDIPEPAGAISWSPDGHQVVAACPSGLFVCHTATGAVTDHLAAEGYTGAIQWSRDQDYIVACTEKSLCVWNRRTGKARTHLLGGDYSTFAVDRSTGYVAARSKYGSGVDLFTPVQRLHTVVDVMSRFSERVPHVKWLSNRPHDDTPSVFAWSADGTALAGAGAGQLCVWDVATDRRQDLPAHPDPAALAFSPDGTRLASAGRDGEVCVWQLERSTLLASINVRSAACLDWSPRGIVVGGPEGLVALGLMITAR